MANPITPVGVPVINPSVATPQAGSEVTNTPSAAEPSVGAKVATFKAGFDPLFEALSPDLGTILPKDSPHVVRVGPTRMQAVALLSRMLRLNPTLVGDFTADDIDADLSDASACRQTSQDLSKAVAAVDDTARLREERAWQRGSAVYVAAKNRAKGNKTLASDVAQVRGILAVGPQATVAAHTAVTAQQAATKATTRAGKATQKANAKTTRATALQHGTGDATITQPAPSAPATTPAPGTPSTPIR